MIFKFFESKLSSKAMQKMSELRKNYSLNRIINKHHDPKVEVPRIYNSLKWDLQKPVPLKKESKKNFYKMDLL